ncbi:MAG: tRNA epoxyqueuosine(34) reductase QueG [Planctomycetota bacterium]
MPTAARQHHHHWWPDLQRELLANGAAVVGAADVAATVAASEWHEVELRLREWTARGEHGVMTWLAEPDLIRQRADPRTRYPWIRSAIVAAFPYNTLPDRESVFSLGQGVVPGSEGRAKISRYAHGLDYHRTVARRIKLAKLRVLARHTRLQLRWYLDTGPVLERQWAERAGIGWLGKHSLLIHPRLGSWFFLAVMFCSEVPPDDAFLPAVPDHCGTCTACIDACPTAALDGQGKVDARRCISYLTIEDPDPAPALLAAHHNGWMLGCDICQQVCPWNRKAPDDADAGDFAPLPALAALGVDEFLAMQEDRFRELFRRTSLFRPRVEKLHATLRLVTGRQEPRPSVGEQEPRP